MKIREFGMNILEKEAMSAYFQASQNDDTYDYIRRENATVSIGLSDRPIQTNQFRRGATEKEVKEEVSSLRESLRFVIKHQSERGVFNDELERFVDSKEEDVYVVFCDDCPPDDWYLFANWHISDSRQEATWRRHAMTLAEAVKKVAEMKPLPPPPPPEFHVDPRFKKEIEKILPLLVEITDEANSPFKIVVEQRRIREELGQWHALLAAAKMRALMWGGRTGYKPPYVGVQDFPGQYTLWFQQCQYDNWDYWLEFFKKHCKIAEWTDRHYQSFPIAYWDLSNDPDFAQAKQKIYPIKIVEYDSHASGF